MKRQSLWEWCKENSREDLLDEWDNTKNAKLGYYPDTIGCKSSHIKVWWTCPLGHSYDIEVGKRTSREDGCPYCSNHRLLIGFNDLAHVAPKLCEEWDYEKNRAEHDKDIFAGVKRPHPATPEEIIYGSATKVFWKCKNGHTSYLSPNARWVDKDGNYSMCDKCATDSRASAKRKTAAKEKNLALLVPKAVEEWVYSEHGLTPFDVSCNSREMVHWKCKKGHEFDKLVTERIGLIFGEYKLRQCSECAKHQKTSIVEQICYYYVKKVFPDAVNSYKEHGFEIDIFIPSLKIGIEYDGSYTHKKRIERDNRKDHLAFNAGIDLFRFRPQTLPDTVLAHRININETIQGVIEGLFIFFSTIGVEPPTMDLEKDYNQIMEIFEERIGKSIIYTPLIDEWDYEKNDIDPKFITSKETKIRVWWKCPNGHPSYKTCPYNRAVMHTKCKKCADLESARTRKKKVVNLDTREVFDSATDAQIKYGKVGSTLISRCCRGVIKTAYGYHWEFFHEEER